MKTILLRFAAALGLLALSFRVKQVPGHIYRTTDYYGALSSGRNDALLRAGLRETEAGQDLAYWKDTSASLTLANGEVLRFGPFPAGSIIVPSTLRILGDGTTDIGDDVNIGYEPVVSTEGTADDNAYQDAADLSVGNIGVNAAPIMAAFQGTDIAPSFLYWVTLTQVDATGAAAGTVTMECFVRHLN